MNLLASGRRYAVAGSLAAACVLAVTVPAAARPAVAEVPPEAFLTGDELPAHESGWYSSGAVAGLPEWPVFCFEDQLPAEAAWHQPYWTEYDTNALQVVVETGDEAAAEALTAALSEAAADCAADWLRENPGASASWDDFGAVDAGDGGHVYGVHTAPQDAGHGVRLFGVGRDGTRVTLVDWGRIGTLQDVPAEEFGTTLGTALDKLTA